MRLYLVPLDSAYLISVDAGDLTEFRLRHAALQKDVRSVSPFLAALAGGTLGVLCGVLLST